MPSGRPRLIDGLEKIAGSFAKSRYTIVAPISGDLTIEWARQGIKAKFPYGPNSMPGPSDALPAIGRDRGIAQGLEESEDGYRQRLLRWRTSWHLAGSAFGLIEQLLGYFSEGTSPWVRVVTDSGTWYYGDETGARTWDHDAWDWDGTTVWTRFWPIIYPGGLIGPGPGWGDPGAKAWGGTGKVWGLDCTPAVIAAIRGIVDAWRPAHAWAPWIVIALDAASFVPGGGGLPGGDWGQWSSTAANRPPVRLSTARYLDGVGP